MEGWGEGLVVEMVGVYLPRFLRMSRNFSLLPEEDELHPPSRHCVPRYRYPSTTGRPVASDSVMASSAATPSSIWSKGIG